VSELRRAIPDGFPKDQRAKITVALDDTLKWIELNASAHKSEYEAQQRDLEKRLQPFFGDAMPAPEPAEVQQQQQQQRGRERGGGASASKGASSTAGSGKVDIADVD
jgi:hypothetical protein